MLTVLLLVCAVVHVVYAVVEMARVDFRESAARLAFTYLWITALLVLAVLCFAEATA